jgi:MFS family permease
VSGRRGLLFFFAVNYLAQGMVGIVYEPIFYILKDSLGLDAAQSAAFVAWMTAPFLLKPLLGLLTDLFPLKGRLRSPHLALSAALGALGWLTLALGPAKPSYWFLLLLLMGVNAAVVFGDVVCDGVMVQAARRQGSSARFQAVQVGTLYVTLVVTGLGGGWLSAHAGPRLVFGLACGLSLLSLFSAFWVEEPAVARPRWSGLTALYGLFLSRRFWALSSAIILWNFTPLLGSAQFYFQSEHLKFGPMFIGLLTTLGGLAGAVGAAVFGRLAGRRLPLERLLFAGVWLGGPLQLLYLFYGGALSAVLITLFLAFTGVIFRLALMDLAARSCPKGAEATAFAAYMSMFNLAAWASNTAGGKLYGALASPAAASALLCAVAAAATLASWPLVAGLRKNIDSPAA